MIGALKPPSLTGGSSSTMMAVMNSQSGTLQQSIFATTTIIRRAKWWPVIHSRNSKNADVALDNFAMRTSYTLSIGFRRLAAGRLGMSNGIRQRDR